MPRPIIRTHRGTHKKYPIGTQGHIENIEERRAEHSIDVQFNRGIQVLKREKMGLASDQPMYEVGAHIRTNGGTSGTIIGSAQYVWGWEYRIEPDSATRDLRSGNKRTIYREEWEIAGPNPGFFDLTIRDISSPRPGKDRVL